MITSRALVERNDHTMVMASFEADEYPRSVQLYGVDPDTVAAAVKILVSEDRADHIDLNMGCPVAKVTRKGGGAALPWKKDLFADLINAAVQTAGSEAAKRGVRAPPVTVKMRKGIDDNHLTFLDAGRIAADAGVAWVALHARTAAQLYGGEADWSAISELVEYLAPTGVPVLGNGDIWTGSDAVAMMEQTGCAGVVVGRGCLGRPWLFGQLADAMAGRPIAPEPDLGGVLAVMRRHAELLTELYGQDKGCRDFRKHVAWYLKGFAVGSATRRGLGLTSSLAELDALIAGIDAAQQYLPEAAVKPRGRTSGQRKVALPEGWLNSESIADSETLTLREAELSVSGG
jgi:nifR3 family TIM-barrel protein